jgi:DNA-binding transcriptional MerR regulator
MSNDKTPDLVTIGGALNLLSKEFPDVSVSSLRFLEREGLLSPQRKPGGHRLYGANELERVRQIKRWQAERISLREIRERLERAPEPGKLDSVVTEMTSYILAGYLWPALDMLKELHQTGTPLLVILNDVLTPVMRYLGDEKGNHLIPVDVQLELDEYLIAFLSTIAAQNSSTTGKPVIVAACPPWERHDMPLRMLMALLAERGAAVHFIGAQVDGEFVRDAITRVDPDSILISLTVRPPQKAATWFADIISIMRSDQRMLIGGMGSTYLPAFNAPNVEVVGMISYAEITDRLMSTGRTSASEG